MKRMSSNCDQDAIGNLPGPSWASPHLIRGDCIERPPYYYLYGGVNLTKMCPNTVYNSLSDAFGRKKEGQGRPIGHPGTKRHQQIVRSESPEVDFVCKFTIRNACGPKSLLGHFRDPGTDHQIISHKRRGDCNGSPPSTLDPP